MSSTFKEYKVVLLFLSQSTSKPDEYEQGNDVLAAALRWTV